jgi:hypothetical protein
MRLGCRIRFARHRKYVAALQHVGVECHIARFSEQRVKCITCGLAWKRHEEKEANVHFSLTFLDDAFDDVFQRATVVEIPMWMRRLASAFRGKRQILTKFLGKNKQRHCISVSQVAIVFPFWLHANAKTHNRNRKRSDYAGFFPI